MIQGIINGLGESIGRFASDCALDLHQLADGVAPFKQQVGQAGVVLHRKRPLQLIQHPDKADPYEQDLVQEAIFQGIVHQVGLLLRIEMLAVQTEAFFAGRSCGFLVPVRAALFSAALFAAVEQA